MIKEEYKRLLALLEEGKENPKDVSLEEILKEAVLFFEELRKSFPSAEKEEREEMIQMMSRLHTKLQEISKITAEATGMSEEELSAFAENPSNFTPEQWQLVQESKSKLYDSARKLSSSLHKGRKEPIEGETPKKPIRSRTRRSRKKEWKKT
ncbi:MAG: hypothetical protein KR126chlam1_00831 [Chlamydiae bacterium]|nr:hypothetical protein [Chlamydiota bacterium]